jgi:magnesium-protoporphyrin O-methyltransferase
MNCCGQCAGLERLFDDRLAQDELKTYRRNGPAHTTRLLLAALKARGVNGLTLLDIGGGVGAIQHDLLRAGAVSALQVDASAAYLAAARAEAERLGHSARAAFRHGDFVDLAPDIEPADVVTLDRVICCYPNMLALVSLSAERARQFYGLVFPRETVWARLFRPVFNSYFRLVGNPYRFYLHSTPAVAALLHERGLRQIFRQQTFFWQVLLYERG